MRGMCIWFSSAKGYGFCVDSATGKEYFTHFSAIQATGYRSLKENDAVEFDVEEGPSGRIQAANVKVIE